MIRAGEKEAVVEGLFELEGEVAIPELAERKSDGARRQLVVRRVIAEGGGRSRVTVDGELPPCKASAKSARRWCRSTGSTSSTRCFAPRAIAKFSIATPTSMKNSPRIANATRARKKSSPAFTN